MNDNQLLAIGDELITSVKEIFPSHAEFNSWIDHSKWAYICDVYWKINNDKNRPNKYSRIISVTISREAIEDSKYECRKQIIQERFKSAIQEKNKSFNPDHDMPRDQPPPMEEWLVDNNSLNH